MKTTILLLSSLCFTMMLYGQVSKTATVTAGNLKTALTVEELNTVTNLTLTGTMDARDFKTMRDDMPLLAELDLSDVKIFGNGTLIQTIPSYAFGSIDLLKSIKLPLWCDEIGDHAFSYCSALTSLVIPRSVHRIENYAFSGCTSLKSITILSNIYGGLGLNDCPNLSSIYLLGNNHPYPYEFHFEDVDKSKCTLYYAPNSYLDYKFKKSIELPWHDVSSYEVSLGAIKDLTSTIEVGSDSDWVVSSNKSWLTVNPTSGRSGQITVTADLNSLETARTALLTFKIDTVTINSVVVSQTGTPILMNVSAGDFSYLNYDEFQLLSSIRLIGTIDKSDMDVMKRMPLLSEIDMREVDILAYADGSYVFPENTIPYGEFGNSLDITYPDSSFYKLKSIFLPYSCTSIGDWAFCNCRGLTSVTIPSSVTSIGGGAFSYCPNLTSIFAHPKSPAESGMFSDVKLRCTLFVPYGSLLGYAQQWGYFRNIIEIPFVEVFKSQLNLASSTGSTAATKIVSDLSWTAGSDQTWLTLSQNTGSGESLLTFTAEANPGASPRTATVTVSADGVETQTITITQEGGPTALPDLVENSNQFNCYPNPFNSVTTINWQLAKTSKVTLKVLDIVGRTVATLVDEQRPQGKYEIQFDAGTMPKGIYFCQLKAGEFSQTQKMILLK